jgi:hypothetical protein
MPAPKLRKKLISVQSNFTFPPPELFKYANKNASFPITKPKRARSLHPAHAYTRDFCTETSFALATPALSGIPSGDTSEQNRTPPPQHPS